MTQISVETKLTTQGQPVSDSTCTNTNILKITIPEFPAYDPLSRLRQSRFGRIYRNHLKKNKLFTLLAAWLWRNGYPIYIRFKVRTSKSSLYLPMVKLSEYTSNSPELVYKLAEVETVNTPLPAVYPNKDSKYLAALHERYIFPSIFVTTVYNASVIGGTNLIKAGGVILCHDLYDFSRDFTSEELHGRAVIYPNKNRLHWFMDDSKPEVLPSAAVFVDACAHNYAHWMTEVLPRICLFCMDERFDGIPVIVNDNLHANLMESLLMIAGANHTIMTLPIGRSVEIEQLFSVSPTGYVPFERRTNRLINHSHGLFSPYALTALGNKLKAIVPADGIVSPQKIYLRRNSGIRKIINNAEIETVLTRNGFSIIEPEQLSFAQQVILFSNANVVVAGTGAACANLIFCKPAAHILILISKHKDLSYGYWQNMSCAIGGRVTYVLGDVEKKSALNIHGDYSINTADILAALNAAETDAN